MPPALPPLLFALTITEATYLLDKAGPGSKPHLRQANIRFTFGFVERPVASQGDHASLRKHRDQILEPQ